jgi:hypothetical protein
MYVLLFIRHLHYIYKATFHSNLDTGPSVQSLIATGQGSSRCAQLHCVHQVEMWEGTERKLGELTWNSSPIPSASDTSRSLTSLRPTPLTFLTSSFERVQSWMHLTLERRLTTAPQISSPLSSSSPLSTMVTHCQHWSRLPSADVRGGAHTLDQYDCLSGGYCGVCDAVCAHDFRAAPSSSPGSSKVRDWWVRERV